MNPLSSMYSNIVRFWLRPYDTASISVCRILVAMVSIGKSIHYLRDAPLIYGAANPLVSPETAREVWTGVHLNVFSLVNDPAAVDALAIIVPSVHLLAAIGMMCGFKTRFSILVLLIAACSMSFRNLMVVTGADAYQITTLALLLFSRCGGRYSVDYWLARRAGKFYKTWSVPAFDYLIRMQVFMLYASAAAVKLLRPVWQEGYALYYVFRQKNFQLFILPAFMYEPWISKVLSYGTLILETVLAIALWFKPVIRYPLLVLAVLFHLGMHWTLNIPLFQPFVMATLICFVDPKDVRKLERRLGSAIGKNKNVPHTADATQ